MCQEFKNVIEIRWKLDWNARDAQRSKKTQIAGESWSLSQWKLRPWGRRGFEVLRELTTSEPPEFTLNTWPSYSSCKKTTTPFLSVVVMDRAFDTFSLDNLPKPADWVAGRGGAGRVTRKRKINRVRTGQKEHRSKSDFKLNRNRTGY